MSTAITLQSPDTTKWDITVSTAGVLTVTSGSSAAAQTVVLASPDATKWDLTVDNGGILTATSGSVGTAAAATITDSNDDVWAITISNAGVLTVTNTGSAPAPTYTGNFVPIYLAATDVQNRVPVELVAANNANGAVPCRVIADTRAAIPVVVTADKANGLVPIILV